MTRRGSILLAGALAAVVFAIAGGAVPAPASGCTITWVGDVDGNWSTNAAGDTNWDDDTLPNGADHVCVNSPSTVALTGPASVSHWTIASGAKLTITGGRLNAGTASTNAGTIELAGGGSGLALADGDNQTVDLVTNTGTISSTGTGGEQEIAAEIANQGTLSVAHENLHYNKPATQLDNNRVAVTLTNTGTIDVASTGRLFFDRGTLIQQGTITGALGGRVDLTQSGATLRISGGSIGVDVDVNLMGGVQNVSDGAGLAFVNATGATGRIDVAGNGGGNHTISGNVPSGITVDIEQDKLFAGADWTNAGTINLAAANAALGTADGSNATVETLTNTGTIASIGGSENHDLLGDVLNQGTVSVAHDGLRYNASGFQFDNNRTALTLTNTGIITTTATGVLAVDRARLVNQGNGAINGQGRVDFVQGQSTLQISGGSIADTADVNVIGGVQNVSGGAALAFVNATGATGRIDVAGNSGGDHTLTGNVPTGITIDIEQDKVFAGADWTNAGTINLAGANAVLGTGDGNANTVETLTNTGAIISTGAGQTHELLGDVVNQGTLSATHDRLRYAASGFQFDNNRTTMTLTNMGTLSAVTGGRLEVDKGILAQAPGGTITGLGAIDVRGRLKISGGLIDSSADLDVIGASGNCCGNAGGAPIELIGASAATGKVGVSFGLGESDLGGNHAVLGNVPPGLTLEVEAGKGLVAAADWVNNGTIILSGINSALITSNGNATLAETLTNAGTGTIRTIGNGGRFIRSDILNEGTVSVENPSTVFQNEDSRTLKLTNAATGTVNVTSVGVATFQGTQPLANAGTVTTAGELLANGFTQSAGTTTVSTGGKLSSATVDGGLLQGTGTIQGTLTNGGEVSPGPGIGTLKVTGAYTQTPAGKLSVRAQSGGFDQLDSDGAATLDGTLAITTGAPAPAQNDQFKVLDSTSRSGQFSSVTGAGTGPYDVQYGATGVTLVTQSPAALPEMSIDDVSVVEPDLGTATLTFTARLSQAVTFPVSAKFTTRDDTARALSDYTATTGTVSFAAGQTARPVTVTVGADAAGEPNERLTVELSDPDGVRFADDEGTGTILNDDLELSRVTPNRGGDRGSVDLTALGAGFIPGTILQLRRSGQADITATGARANFDSRSGSGVLKLLGAAHGPWDVVATLPDGRATATLPGAFTVEGTRPADVWVKFTGRDTARTSLPYDGWIAYGNTGNVDATGVTIEISGLPKFDLLKLPYNDPSGTISRDENGRTITFHIPRVPPGGARFVPFEGRFTTVGSTVKLRARIIPNRFDPDQLPAADPAIRATTQVLEQTDDRQRGIHTLTPGGDIAFDYRATPASGESAGKLETTRPSAGVLRHRFTGATEIRSGVFLALDYTMEGPATAFESLRRYAGGGGPAQLLRHMSAAGRKGPGKLDLLDVKQAAGSVTTHLTRLQLLDCLLHQKKWITQDDYDALLGYADASRNVGLLGLVPTPGGPAGQVSWGVITGSVESLTDGVFIGETGSALQRVGQNWQGEGPSILQNAPDFAGQVTLFKLALLECGPKPPDPGPIQPPPGGGSYPPAPGGGSAQKDVPVGAAKDPNEKSGPSGAGAEHFIEGDRPLAYTVSFENIATATLPAQQVVITDQLDGSKLDLSTVELGPVGFGDFRVPVPPGLQSYSTEVDMRPENNLLVRIEGSLNPTTGLLTWRLESIDPATGAPTTDPSAGFLPPNTNPRAGEGNVAFSASPVAGLADGTKIENAASIVFDTEAAIVTNTFSNTIDSKPPTSKVGSVASPAGACTTNLAVAWSGADSASGVAGYDVYAAEGNGSFRPWLSETTATSGTWKGKPGTAYRFFTVARDRAGHAEGVPFAAAVAGTTATCATPKPVPPVVKPGVGKLQLITKSARHDRKRVLKLKARCRGDAGATCAGTLTLIQRVVTGKGKRKKTRNVRVGSVRYKLAVGKTATLRLKLTKKAVTAIRRGKRLVLRVNNTPKGGKAKLLTRVTVRPPKARRG